MDTETEICKHLENQTVAWELTYNAFMLEAVLSLRFSPSYKREFIREFKSVTDSFVREFRRQFNT
jgi:catalase (peroxidase I)